MIPHISVSMVSLKIIFIAVFLSPPTFVHQITKDRAHADFLKLYLELFFIKTKCLFENY